MLRKRDWRRLTRGLRFRLTASYSLFFAVLLVGVALLFRARLSSELETQVEDTLNERWAAVKGYLRIDKDAELGGQIAAAWYYDADDEDEKTIVFDIRKIYLITDQYGHVILNHATSEPAVSTTYQQLGIDKPEEIAQRVREAVAAARPARTGKAFWLDRRTPQGEPIKIRGGIVYDELHRAPYYVALGESVADNEVILQRYTLINAAVTLGALILTSVLGWAMAGKVLTPVKDVAQAAQRISGSNLTLRIPSREAGDELDYLILTFNRMMERLEASFQQMKQFSADVSHELRTPITAIRGQLEVALFTAKSTDQYREAMFNALQDIEKLSQIVRALLLLSQAESGQLVLQKTRLDLSSVLSELVEQFQIPAEEAGVRLTADLPPECPAEVDRVQIERMVTNLLSNALKFTPRDGEVRLGLTASEGKIGITVADTGQGIATEHLPHIFDRFYRVPGSGTAPTPEQGLGLGLSFVAWIVKAHRGKIDVESRPGQGTRFHITLPAADAAPETQELRDQRPTLA